MNTLKTAALAATTVANLNDLVEDVKIAEELVSETICEDTSLDVWRDVEGFEGRYEVSLSGYLRFADKPDKRKVKCSKNGNYLTALLYHRGDVKPTYAKIHMLVAKAFVPNPEGYAYVSHKNGRLEDNRADNLEWVETEPQKRKKRKSKRTSKTVSASPNLEVPDSEVGEGDVLEYVVAEGYVPDDDLLEGDVSERDASEGELWKDVMGFEGLYKISKSGMLVSFWCKKPRFIKPMTYSRTRGGHFVDVVPRGWLCELLQCKFLFSRSFLSFFCFTYDG